MTFENIPLEKKIILFDGVCNLCNQSVQLIIKNDKNDAFRFVALQSPLGNEIIKKIGLNIKQTDTIVLYEPGVAYYIKAQAAFKIARELGGFYRLISIMQYLPANLTNFFYDYIAKNRYKWYGKRDSCMIPTPEIVNKFL